MVWTKNSPTVHLIHSPIAASGTYGLYVNTNLCLENVTFRGEGKIKKTAHVSFSRFLVGKVGGIYALLAFSSNTIKLIKQLLTTLACDKICVERERARERQIEGGGDKNKN